MKHIQCCSSPSCEKFLSRGPVPPWRIRHDFPPAGCSPLCHNADISLSQSKQFMRLEKLYINRTYWFLFHLFTFTHTNTHTFIHPHTHSFTGWLLKTHSLIQYNKMQTLINNQLLTHVLLLVICRGRETWVKTKLTYWSVCVINVRGGHKYMANKRLSSSAYICI